MSIEEVLDDKSEEISEGEETKVEAPEEEKVVLTKAEHEALLKAKEVGENYKKENEKYRVKKDRTVSTEETKTTLQDDQVKALQNDYLSKREDVYEEFSAELQTLDDQQWEKIKPLITPAMDTAYFEAVNNGRYVPAGKLRGTIQNLIDYAKGEKSKQQAVDKATRDTAIEMSKVESAEISATKSTRKVGGKIQITDEDRQTSEDTGGALTAERIAENRTKREEREKNYAS